MFYNTELRFYRQIKVNYRGNQFYNTGPWSTATTGRLYTNWSNGLCIVNFRSCLKPVCKQLNSHQHLSVKCNFGILKLCLTFYNMCCSNVAYATFSISQNRDTHNDTQHYRLIKTVLIVTLSVIMLSVMQQIVIITPSVTTFSLTTLSMFLK